MGDEEETPDWQVEHKESVRRVLQAQREYDRIRKESFEKIDRAHKRRVVEIQQAYINGVSQRRLAKLANISWSRVHQMIHYSVTLPIAKDPEDNSHDD